MKKFTYKKNKKEVDDLKSKWKTTKTLMSQCVKILESLSNKAFKQEKLNEIKKDI